MSAWLAIDLYSLLVLAVVEFSNWRMAGRRTLRELMFRGACLYTAVLVGVHALMSWGGEAGFTWLQELGCSLSYALNPGILIFWVAYVMTFTSMQANPRLGTTSANITLTSRDLSLRWADLSRELKAVLAVCVANLALVALNPSTGLLFRFEATGTYIHGPLFWVRFAALAGIVLLLEAYILMYRDRVGFQVFWFLVITPVMPAIGAFAQTFTHMLGLELAGMALTVGMLQLFVQGRVTAVDALTGLSNRREFESRLDQLVEEAQQGRPFSAVLLDLDKFKAVNDSYGHARGDEVLIMMGEAMASSFGQRATLARLGGDEFAALIASDDEVALRASVEHLRSALVLASRTRQLPFVIDISAGYGVFDPAVHQSGEAFIRQLDEMLYEEKERKGSVRRSPLSQGEATGVVTGG